MKTAETIGSELSRRISGDVLIDVYNRVAYSTDASIYRIQPQCVVCPKGENDIAVVVQYANENEIPIAPRGAGSGVAGESLTGGIVIDTRRYMNKILQISPDWGAVTCQPGVILEHLNDYLARFDRKIGPDPSSGNRAVIGGVVANNATGAHSLEYGYIADHVQRIRAVLFDGTVAEFENNIGSDCADSTVRNLAEQVNELLGPKQDLIQQAQPATQRNRCGYTIQGVVRDGRVDLAKLLAGSEGTLAVFTEMTLKTVPVPKVKALVQFEFDNFAKMAEAVPRLVESGASACELMDRSLIKMAREAFPEYKDVLPTGCAATLLVEHVGDDEQTVDAKLKGSEQVVEELARDFMEVTDPVLQGKLWKSRKDAVPLLNRQKGPAHPLPFIEDVSVESCNLDKYIAGLEKLGDQYDIPMAFYGHAGDGELHIRPYLDLTCPDDVQRMREIAAKVFELAWSLGGSVSGEHADGLLRAAFVKQQYGDEYYELLKGVKKIFDPRGIMNPGKILNEDPDVMVQNLRVTDLEAAKSFETELAFEPDEFRFEFEQCNGCGVCLSESTTSRMCPVFRGLGDELASTRAKAGLLSEWFSRTDAAHDFDYEGFKKVMSLCVNCRMCSIECPAGVDVSKMVIEARAQMAKQTEFSNAELLLINNRYVSKLAGMFAPLSNWAMGLWPVRMAMQLVIGLDHKRRMPAFERGTFIKLAGQYLKEKPLIADPVDKVVYFVDSYANFNDHELGFKVLDVLRANCVTVMVPDQRPSPVPSYVYGHLKLAREDMRYNLAQIAPLVREGYKVVCSEPSAALCLKDELRLMIDSEDAKLVADNTYELMEYLAGLHDEGLLKNKKSKVSKATYAYHAPCHLRALRSAGVSIDLVTELCGAEVFDVQGGCCGMAGTAGMQRKNRTLSEKLGKQLAKKINELNVDTVLTECAACKMQIEQFTDKQVLHPVKVIAKAYE